MTYPRENCDDIERERDVGRSEKVRAAACLRLVRTGETVGGEGGMRYVFALVASRASANAHGVPPRGGVGRRLRQEVVGWVVPVPGSSAWQAWATVRPRRPAVRARGGCVQASLRFGDGEGAACLGGHWTKGSGAAALWLQWAKREAWEAALRAEEG